MLSQTSELKGGKSADAGDAVLRADRMDSFPAGSWDKMLCSSQATWVMGTGGLEREGNSATSVG
jgi:hypothetical protein